MNQDQTLPSLGRYPVPEKFPQKHLSFTENPEIEGEPSNFQEGPENRELPGISPLGKDKELETAAKAMTLGTKEIPGAEALPEGPQPPTTATVTSPASSEITTATVTSPASSEITFNQRQVLDLNISDTIMQGTSTPIPQKPQVETSSAQAGVPIMVPEYLHRFCRKVLAEWNAHFPYKYDEALYPLITKDKERYYLNWQSATAKNVSLLNVWSDEEKGRKSKEQSREQSPK